MKKNGKNTKKWKKSWKMRKKWKKTKKMRKKPKKWEKNEKKPKKWQKIGKKTKFFENFVIFLFFFQNFSIFSKFFRNLRFFLIFLWFFCHFFISPLESGVLSFFANFWPIFGLLDPFWKYTGFGTPFGTLFKRKNNGQNLALMGPWRGVTPGHGPKTPGMWKLGNSFVISQGSWSY